MFACVLWKLLWTPEVPLDDADTPILDRPPCLVIDAKARYDLSTKDIKDEIQAACGTDRCAAIETLVCQDKLQICRVQTKWVSSELQYADSMTKSDTEQFLADGMQTHLTRIRSGEIFQTAKKKDAKLRRMGVEMFAVRRPTRTM